ncbi:DUF4062 domain-containing protein [Brevibacterium aurantiacum]|uniref:DUF4062 domain-containing protein n=1 Tax=Brevibacterium aurantiacum TaxID=273384 RepID=UPI00299F8B0C|nr:DUF4062 domain-containing protein [Brevibacterium aurantiacum]
MPLLGSHPQSLINSQGVDDSDVVFAIFGSRLGSPTPDAVSGTVEEIERANDQGKPVHVYFSDGPLPNDVDTEQLKGVREFKKQLQARGLLGTFSNVSQLAHEVWRAIEHDVETLALEVPVLNRTNRGVKFQVQPRHERELKHTDAKGKAHYRTRRWVEVTNVGDEDAQEVTFKAASENAALIVISRGEPTVVHAGQTRNVNIEFTMGGTEDRRLLIEWVENGEHKEASFHID